METVSPSKPVHLCWPHPFVVCGILLFEKVHAGHGNDADVLAFSAQLGISFDAQVALGAGAD